MKRTAAITKLVLVFCAALLTAYIILTVLAI